jgi:hypothetical protein
MLLAGSEEKIFWTSHSRAKMRQYGFSEKRVLNIYRKPERKESGIAPKTIASMQVTGTSKNPREVWVMYAVSKGSSRGKKLKVIRIISAWKYPGRTPLGQRPMIPDDVLEELKSFKKHEYFS